MLSGTGAVVCALARGACCNRVSDTLSKSLCPALFELNVKGSSCIRFRCLETAVRLRTKSMDGDDSSKRPIRVIKPLKRSVLSHGTPAAARGSIGYGSPTTPRKVGVTRAASPVPASPNGSFVDGWRAHEVSRPCKLRVVRIEDCADIPEAALETLRSKKYQLTEVSSSVPSR